MALPFTIGAEKMKKGSDSNIDSNALKDMCAGNFCAAGGIDVC